VIGMLHSPQACRRGYFHCVEIANPAMMNPNPISRFQFVSDSIGNEPPVT
jgi:hypothetical protein